MMDIDVRIPDQTVCKVCQWPKWRHEQGLTNCKFEPRR